MASLLLLLLHLRAAGTQCITPRIEVELNRPVGPSYFLSGTHPASVHWDTLVALGNTVLGVGVVYNLFGWGRPHRVSMSRSNRSLTNKPPKLRIWDLLSEKVERNDHKGGGTNQHSRDRGFSFRVTIHSPGSGHFDPPGLTDLKLI